MIFQQIGPIDSARRFTFPDIAGMLVDHWFDGDDKASLWPDPEPSAILTLWRDKSGNTRNLEQSTAPLAPTVATETRTGRTCVEGDGTMSSIPTISNEFMFAVAINLNAATDGTIFYNGTEGTNGYGLKIVSGNFQLKIGATTVSGGTAYTGVSIISAYEIAGDIKLLRNGSEIGTASGGSSQALTGNLTIGEFDGTLCEFIDVGRDIGTELDEIVEYLIWKWAAYPNLWASQREQISSTITFDSGNYLDGIVSETGPTEEIGSNIAATLLQYFDSTTVLEIGPTEQISSAVALNSVTYIDGVVPQSATTEQISSAVAANSVSYIDGTVSETASTEQISSTIAANSLTYS